MLSEHTHIYIIIYNEFMELMYIVCIYIYSLCIITQLQIEYGPWTFQKKHYETNFENPMFYHNVRSTSGLNRAGLRPRYTWRLVPCTEAAPATFLLSHGKGQLGWGKNEHAIVIYVLTIIILIKHFCYITISLSPSLQVPV